MLRSAKTAVTGCSRKRSHPRSRRKDGCQLHGSVRRHQYVLFLLGSTADYSSSTCGRILIPVNARVPSSNRNLQINRQINRSLQIYAW